MYRGRRNLYQKKFMLWTDVWDDQLRVQNPLWIEELMDIVVTIVTMEGDELCQLIWLW